MKIFPTRIFCLLSTSLTEKNTVAILPNDEYTQDIQDDIKKVFWDSIKQDAIPKFACVCGFPDFCAQDIGFLLTE